MYVDGVLSDQEDVAVLLQQVREKILIKIRFIEKSRKLDKELVSYVCMYVYMYVCVYVCVCVCMFIIVWVCKHVYNVTMYVSYIVGPFYFNNLCMYVCVCVYMYMYVCLCMYIIV